MINALRCSSNVGHNGMQVCVWINPYIAQESKLFDEGAQNGYFIKKTDGSVWQWDWWVSQGRGGN